VNAKLRLAGTVARSRQVLVAECVEAIRWSSPIGERELRLAGTVTIAPPRFSMRPCADAARGSGPIGGSELRLAETVRIAPPGSVALQHVSRTVEAVATPPRRRESTPTLDVSGGGTRSGFGRQRDLSGSPRQQPEAHCIMRCKTRAICSARREYSSLLLGRVGRDRSCGGDVAGESRPRPTSAGHSGQRIESGVHYAFADKPAPTAGNRWRCWCIRPIGYWAGAGRHSRFEVRACRVNW